MDKGDVLMKLREEFREWLTTAAAKKAELISTEKWLEGFF